MKIGKFLEGTRFICDKRVGDFRAPTLGYGYSLSSRDALDGRNRNTRRIIMSKNVYEFISGAELNDVEMVCEAHRGCKNAPATAERLAKTYVEGIAFSKVIEQKKGKDYVFTVIRVQDRIMRHLVVIR